MVLRAGVVGRHVDPQRALERQKIPVPVIAMIEHPLMIVRLGGENVDVAARGGQFGAVEQQHAVRTEFGVGPGVLGHGAAHMHVMIGDGQIVEPQALGKANYLCQRVV